MKKEDVLKKQLESILPDRADSTEPTGLLEDRIVAKEAAKLKQKQDAKELAKIKYAEKQKLRYAQDKAEKLQALAEEYDLEEVPVVNTENQLKKVAEQQKRVEAIEAIEAQIVEPLDLRSLAKRNKLDAATVNSALQLQGTSRPEVLRLLTSLNINLSIQLTKQDTANLLACLLTCNDAQLTALYNNKKIPIVIKTVIKRLQEDARLGNIDTIEKLWDRVFGKGQMCLNLPETQQLETGIIPNMPVSREAYIVIRDTLIK